MEAASLVTSLGFSVDSKSMAAFEHVQRHIEQIKTRLEVLAGAEIVRGLYELTERFGSMGEQLESASVAAGLTTEEYQALTYAAAQNGVAQDEMATGLARLSRSLYMARQGSKEAAESFTNIGITPEQLASFHTSEDAFMAIGDALKRLPDATQQVALLQEVMGRGSYKLLKFAMQGGHEITRLKKEAVDIGAVLQENYIANLAKSEDAVTGFRQVVGTVVAELGARFAPNVIAITRALEKFWLRNREIIMSRLDDWFYKIGFAIGATYAAFELLGDGIARFVRGNGDLFEKVSRITELFLGLSAGMGALGFAWDKLKKIFSGIRAVFDLFITPFKAGLFAVKHLRNGVGALTRGLGTLIEEIFPALGAALIRLGVAIEATPVGLIATALAALVIAGYTAYQMYNGVDFKDTTFAKSMTWLWHLIKDIAAALDSLTGNRLSRFIMWAYDKVGPANTDLLQPFRDDKELAIAGRYARSAGSLAKSGGSKLLDIITPPSFGPPLPPVENSTSTSIAANPTSTQNVTINVNGAQQPQVIAQQIAAQLNAHQDAMNRSTMANMQTALVH